MVGHLIPIRRSAHDIFAGSYALLVLTPVTAQPGPPIELMRFAVRPDAVGGPRCPWACYRRDAGRDRGKRAGVAISTVRSQLRKVLEKEPAAPARPTIGVAIANVTLDRSATKN